MYSWKWWNDPKQFYFSIRHIVTISYHALAMSQDLWHRLLCTHFFQPVLSVSSVSACKVRSSTLSQVIGCCCTSLGRPHLFACLFIYCSKQRTTLQPHRPWNSRMPYWRPGAELSSVYRYHPGIVYHHMQELKESIEVHHFSIWRFDVGEKCPFRYINSVGRLHQCAYYPSGRWVDMWNLWIEAIFLVTYSYSLLPNGWEIHHTSIKLGLIEIEVEMRATVKT